MRAELIVKGRSLTGTSDLTLLAPIIPGLIPSLGSITYKTRVKQLLAMLQGSRVAMHEYSTYRPFADAVERVAMIHSFRVVVLEPEDKVMLAVTFDATWESYIRVLWQKVGTLLDIIFCNTEGYVVSDDASFESWCSWVRKVQVETAFFYATHGLTVQDTAYLRGEEEIHRQVPSGVSQDLHATRHHVVSAEDISFAASNASSQGALECLRQGLLGLAVMFRLTETYLPGTPDGDILLRATHDLLQEFIALTPAQLPSQFAEPMKERFARQLDWLASAPLTARQLPPLPIKAPTDMYAQIQAGILFPYQKITHGCLIFIAVDRPSAGAALLDHLMGLVTTEKKKPPAAGLVCNVAVSYEGFRALGLAEWQLALFPQEFREGMEARASMLGDFRANHPRRWNLPEPNWPVSHGKNSGRVEMSTVHIAVQLRIGAPGNKIFDPADPRHPLFQVISDIATRPGTKKPRDGIRILHVQELRRLFDEKQNIIEHFGFADCVSDPVFDGRYEGKVYRNRVQLGEFLVARDNEADAAPIPHTPNERERLEWLRDGSFLVVRKLAQHVDRLYNAANAISDGSINRDMVLAKMVGRARNGSPLAAPHLPANNNDFDYSNDKDGSKCPFHAHIRRGNPRPQEPDQIVWGPDIPLGARRPRLMRRGLSYGPPLVLRDEGPVQDDGQKRGLVFMAYNASIAEQFEVIQRWLTGGNSAGGHSRQSDPLLGVPDWNEQRRYRFEDEKRGVRRMNLDRAPSPIEEPLPFVRLEWGIYLFTPSISALRKLRTTAGAALSPASVWSVEQGEAKIQGLVALEREQGHDVARLAWKAAVEDPEEQRKYRSASIWAAIRAQHGGVLRTPYGVIIADRARALDVLTDTHRRFTVAGYHERAELSIGEIYLGLDAGPEYKQQSHAANRAVGHITEEAAFDLSFRRASEALARFVAAEQGLAQARALTRWELDFEASEVVDRALATMCQDWFGLPTDQHSPIVPGSWNWEWKDSDPPIYPAHFTAPSRYLFQPWPGPEVKEYGERIGKALTAAIARFIRPHRQNHTVPQTPDKKDAPLAKELLRAFPDGAEYDLMTARTFCGVLMGFLPTVDGNVLRSLNEWLIDGTFWSLRAAWFADAAPSSYAKAVRLLSPALAASMQLRPSPELLWRRAVQGGFQVGEVDVHAGDTIVVSLVSATQQCLDRGSQDLSLVFGGQRTPAAGGPTHACPARAAGMGAVMGILSSLVSAPEICRPALAPLAFKFEGATP